MRFDVHAHYWTDDYLSLLAQQLGKTETGTQRGLGAGGGTDLDARLRLMDRAGVETQVLSASPQLPYPEDREKATAVVNDQYAELVARHSDRFRAFAALPSPHIDSHSRKWAALGTIWGWSGYTSRSSLSWIGGAP